MASERVREGRPEIAEHARRPHDSRRIIPRMMTGPAC